MRRQLTTAVTALAVMATTAAVVLTAGAPAQAANPMVTNRFVADPSAHVFNGRMYVYATDDSDNSGTYWDSTDWRAYSTTDTLTWTDHGQVFSLGGFSWATRLAWAPTAAQRNGSSRPSAPHCPLWT